MYATLIHMQNLLKLFSSNYLLMVLYRNSCFSCPKIGPKRPSKYGTRLPFLFDLRFICLWWINCSEPYPLNQDIKCIYFIDLDRTVNIYNIEWYQGTYWNNITIGFKQPLSHIIFFSFGRSEHTAQDFRIEGRLVFFPPKVTPIIPFILSYV